jgi:hypothetical protein
MYHFFLLRLIQNKFHLEEKCKGNHLVAETDTEDWYVSKFAKYSQAYT